MKTDQTTQTLCGRCGQRIWFWADETGDGSTGDWMHYESDLIDVRFCYDENHDDEIAYPVTTAS